MTSEIQHLLFNSYKLPSPPDGLIPGPLSHLLAETSQMPPLPRPRTPPFLQSSLEKIF